MSAQTTVAPGTRSESGQVPRSASVMPPVLVGIFLRALQMTVIAPSLVSIAHSLRAGLADVGWIMAVYASGSLVAQPIAGRMSDVTGRRAVFAAALGVFVVGSAACALSTSLIGLVFGRAVQSLGAGALQPAAIALIGQRMPRDRQSAALYALYGMFALAGVLGAVLGGALIDGSRALAQTLPVRSALHSELLLYPWHLIFWINVPLALVALALTARLEPDRTLPQPPLRQPLALDPGAMLLIPVATLSLMFAASGDSGGALQWLAVSAAALAALVCWERKASHAFFDASLFKGRGPLLLYALAAASGIPIFSVTMYSAAYYMAQFSASALQAGIALLALALPLGLGQGLGGALCRRVSLRVLLLAGIGALALGDLALSQMQSMLGMLVALGLSGLGIGLGTAPPNALLLRYVSQERSGAATGVLTMLSSTGAITAPAAVSALLHYSRLPAAHSFRLAFLLSFLVAALCLALAAFLPHPEESAR